MTPRGEFHLVTSVSLSLSHGAIWQANTGSSDREGQDGLHISGPLPLSPLLPRFSPSPLLFSLWGACQNKRPFSAPSSGAAYASMASHRGIRICIYLVYAKEKTLSMVCLTLFLSQVVYLWAFAVLKKSLYTVSLPLIWLFLRLAYLWPFAFILKKSL